MRKLTTLLALLLFAVSQGAYAQKTITGKVINAEDGLAMAGVSVVVKGTTTGMSTTSNGNFVLNVPDGATIVASFVGFKTVELQVGNETRLDITLQPDANVLSEVVVTAARAIPPERAVVTAMGIVRDKKTLTTSIQSISGAELNRASDPNFMIALSNYTPGLNVFTNGNTTVMETIRGIKSWTYGAEAPLFVIDGVPQQPIERNKEFSSIVDISSIIDRINPENIESITVLKSANAAMLYGSDAANGAIVITTKK